MHSISLEVNKIYWNTRSLIGLNLSIQLYYNRLFLDDIPIRILYNVNENAIFSPEKKKD